MKIATFNLNNVVRRLPNLLDWLRTSEPDVVCLQELKATDASFPEAAIQDTGYGAVWRGQRSWNGVAILARRRKPILVRDELPGDPTDAQSRYIEAAVDGVLIACIYLPNGNPQPGPKFDYKLAWFDRLIAHAAELYAAGVPAILAGDYNVVPTDLDIYPTKSWANDALLQREIGRGSGVSWIRAGPMRSARFIHRSRCTRFGITSGVAGNEMPVSASTTSCSVRRWQAAWWRSGLIAMSGRRSVPVITRQLGLCFADDGLRWRGERAVRRLRDRCRLHAGVR